MIGVNINKPLDVDVRTPSERDAGQVDVGIQKDVEINIKPTVGIKINDNKKSTKDKMNFAKAINGDIMIFGHKDIDIVILKEQKKIVAFAKDMLTDDVYGAESRLFDFLRKQGVVSYDSIQGGNIYGSMEAQMLKAEKKIKEPLVLAAHIVNEWIKEEKPMMDYMEAHDDMIDDVLLSPDEDNATELGEVPHEIEKGSIHRNNMFAPYMYGRNMY
jgi:hypothetical protein